MRVTDDQLRDLLALYDQGQLLRAHELAESVGPMRQWEGPAARVLAGRLAMNLGAARLGRVLHKLAWRDAPEHPEARYYHARAVFESHGPLRTWEFLERCGPDLPGAADAVRADWLALHGYVAGSVRDFETAEAWLGRAEAICPDRAWLQVERSTLLEREDRYPEALDAARRALALRPWYRPAVQAAAHLLQLLDRDAEALDLLREAAERLQSGPVVMQLGAMQTELRQYEDARRSWDRMPELSPLADKHFADYVSARRSDAAYYCGDFDAAIELARASKNGFHEKVAERLAEARGQGKRVVLPVAFVRQHHMTCAPATLTAIGRYWSMPVEHLPLAEEICYDGTPAHGERAWAERNGYVAREFTVSWDSALALLDRGVPFTLTTADIASGHLQAAIGYDGLRGTLLVRDPFERHSGEFIVEGLLERFASSGPRGMTMAPADRPALLDGIDLPDRALYDALYDLQRALVAHRRDAARRAYDSMEAAAPGHRLTLHARRSLAAYDADEVEGLACVEKLLALFPDDGGLQLGRLAHLRALARRDDRVQLLRTLCAKKGSDPIFWTQLAQELRDDAREQPAAVRLLRRALRYRRSDAIIYAALAGMRWDQGAREEALRLYRWATSLDDKHEGLARSYFIAARHFRRADEALRQMRDRFERSGARSSWPARTLLWAYEELERPGEGFAVLEQALKLRPDDGELMLAAADAFARYGDFDRAAALIASAEGRTQRTYWLRTSADVAGYRGELAAARDLWRQVVDAEPLAVDAHRRYAQLLAETEGEAAARAHVRATADRFPHNYALHQSLIGWLRDADDPAETEAAVRRLVQIHPADGWARRELVDCLLAQRRTDEALAEAEEALRLDPSNPSSHFFHGRALAAAGRMADARAAQRRAVERSVDAAYAIAELMTCCETQPQRREALAFVSGELARQTIFGDGLLTYRPYAAEVLEPDELLAELRAALAARPDLWHAHAAVARQLVDVGQLDEASRAAEEAVARFPLLPALWLDLAVVRRLRGDREGERAALAEALHITPGWTKAGRMLAEAHERDGDFRTSRALLEQAVARAPLDALAHGGLADALWKLGEREAALARVEQAVLLEPGYDWAWSALREWGPQVDRPDAAERAARDLTVRRAGEPRSWLVLAQNLPADAEHLDERLAALARAAELYPRSLEAHDQRAELLARAGRYDEALAACRPTAWGDAVPAPLRGRAAWILAEQGDLEGAVAAIRGVLAEDPNYQWGWTQLCTWLRRREDWRGYHDAAAELVRRWPHDTTARGYLGDAKQRTGDRAGAKAELRRAVELTPDYQFGASTLVEMHIADRELDEAATALGLLERHGPDDEITLTRRAELSAARGDTDAALATLARLCARPTPDVWPLETVAAALDARKAGRKVERTFRASLAEPTTNPYVGTAWLARLVSGARWREIPPTLRAIFDAKGVGERSVGAHAAWASLEQVGDAGKARVLRKVVRRHRALLHGDDAMWGLTGSALREAGDFKRVLAWMGDWQVRAGARPWMLLHLLSAAARLGRADLAAAVAARAAGLPADDTSVYHRIWLATEAAMAAAAGGPQAARRADEAVNHLSGVTRAELGAFYQFLFDVTHALIALGRLGPGEPVPARVGELLARAEHDHPKFEQAPELKRPYRAALRAAARRMGFFGTPWWYRSRLLNLAAPGGTGHVSEVPLGVWILLVVVVIRVIAAFNR